jgi:hypothetical protein
MGGSPALGLDELGAAGRGHTVLIGELEVHRRVSRLARLSAWPSSPGGSRVSWLRLTEIMEEGYSEAKSNTTTDHPCRRPSRAPAPAPPFTPLYAAQNGDRVAVLSAGDDTRLSALAPWPQEDPGRGHLADLRHAERARHGAQLRRAVAEGAVFAILGHHRPVVVVARVQAEDVAGGDVVLGVADEVLGDRVERSCRACGPASPGSSCRTGGGRAC